MLLSFMMALGIISQDEVRPSGFYVAGIQQGMTLADYNSLIANGGFRSQPIRPDTYWAMISGQDVFVTFCKGRAVQAVADYDSVDWMESMTVLERIGFRWGSPVAALTPGHLRSGQVVFSATAPKGFSYAVAPMIKGTAAPGKDLPLFQMVFQAFDNPCQ